MAASTPTSKLGVGAPASSVRDETAGVSAPVDALPRRLGFWATTALVAGLIIGSGIFRVSGGVANDVGSVGGVAIVWILGGIITLCGVLSIAELAAAFPASGGLFVYLREAYGPALAFLFGWTALFLYPAGTAGVSLVFAEYLGTMLHLSPSGVRFAAAGAILFAAIVSYRSVRGPGALVSAATVGKLGALVLLVVAAFAFGDGSTGSFGGGAPAASGARVGGIGLGLVAALWAYNGIQDMVSVAGEVRDPQRVLPRALIAGIAVVIAVYLLVNGAYLYALPFDVLRAAPLPAADTAVRVIGPVGVRLVAVSVMISTFGTLTGLVFASPRLFYAMASDGLLFAPLARVHPRFATPHVAVVSLALVSLVCVWSRSFEQLAEAFILGVWPFIALAALGVLVLRRTRPELVRPYRVPGYPVVPLLFVLGTVAVVVAGLVAHPVTTLAGMGLTLVGLPVYWLRVRSARRAIL
jgi:basic amino acid/polyamine antiporter, APA family